MFLVLFVLNNPDLLEEVLTAWEQVGVGGATVLPSTGLGRIRQKEGLRDDVPLMPGLEDFYHHESDISHTLFTIVDSQALAGEVVRVTEQVVGGLDEPGNGILVVVPTVSIHGLIKKSKRTGGEK
jgi:nitrogen regulatory protein P-II 1